MTRARTPHALSFDAPVVDDRTALKACARFVRHWDWLNDAALDESIARNAECSTIFPALKAARLALVEEGLR